EETRSADQRESAAERSSSAEIVLPDWTNSVVRFWKRGHAVKKRQLLFLQTLALVAVPSAGHAQRSPDRAEHQAAAIQVYLSSEEKHESLTEKPSLSFSAQRASTLTIFVDDALKFQEIDGFGASLTESSAYLLKRKLTDAQRADTLRLLFD